MRTLKAVPILVTFAFLLSQPPSFTQEQPKPPQTSPQQQKKVEPLRLGGPDSPLILVNLVPFNGMIHAEPGNQKGIVFGVLSQIQGVWLARADIFNESQESIWLVPYRLTFQSSTTDENLFRWTGQFLFIPNSFPVCYFPQASDSIYIELKPKTVTAVYVFAENAHAIQGPPQSLTSIIGSAMLGSPGGLTIVTAPAGSRWTLDGERVEVMPRSAKAFGFLRFPPPNESGDRVRGARNLSVVY